MFLLLLYCIIAVVVFIIIIIIIIIIVIIVLYWLTTIQLPGLYLPGLNKTPQTSRTFRRILAEYKMVVFCNSTILVTIPISLNHCFNFFGVVPNAPTTTGITVTGISHILPLCFLETHMLP